ncbi:hypothetical protein [Mycolicibacterium sarraceniae]|nr:hypothetical protein [Mycolicibacterium sarraceniae]
MTDSSAPSGIHAGLLLGVKELKMPELRSIDVELDQIAAGRTLRGR